MKKFLAMATTTVLLCAGLSTSPPLAHAATTGTWSNRQGVILVTTDSYSGSIPLGIFAGVALGHSAIIFNKDVVIEALSNGVVRGKNNWRDVRKKITSVSTNGTTAAQDAKAAVWAAAQVGKPYNWNFQDMATRKKFYCSHLVWAAYKDNFKVDLNTNWWDIGKPAIAPTELVSTPKTYTIYTKK